MKLLYLILFVIIFAACQKDEGEFIQKKIALPEFLTLEFRQIFDVTLVQDTQNYVLVGCGSNLMDNVSFFLENNAVNFEQKTETNWNRPYTHTSLEIHFKNLSYILIRHCISLKSADTIKVPNLAIDDLGELSEVDLNVKCTNFRMAVYGENCGIYKVAGEAVVNSLQLEGSAHFLTDGLQSDSTYIRHNGIGDCFVNTLQHLNGEILLDGTIRYKNHNGLKVDISNKRGTLAPF